MSIDSLGSSAAETATSASSPAGVDNDEARSLSGIADQYEEDAYEEDEEYEDEDDDEDEGWFDDESIAFVASLVTHMGIVLLLALMTLAAVKDENAIVIVTPPHDPTEDKIHSIEQIVASEMTQDQIGANADAMEDTALATAQKIADVAVVPNNVNLVDTPLATIDLNNMFVEAAAPTESIVAKKGSDVGQGFTGTTGAVDRLTHEIIQSMQERPTLVVWIFDKSGSLHRQRQEIRNRFDKIYDELGILKKEGAGGFEKKNASEIPLLSSVVSFGQTVELLTEEPTEDLAEIKSAVDQIKIDTTGTERVFSAVFLAANEYKKFRVKRGAGGPLRNVMLVVVTDEKGDDSEGLETTIDLCRRWGMPVYCIGAPAPFGRDHALVKYVHPDPKYEQTAQWARVDAGPETIMPERVKIGYAGNYQDEPIIDSGFGPFALTRLTYETGGLYFSVHPNRDVTGRVRRSDVENFSSHMEYFVDPNIMSRYRPEYTKQDEYMRQVRASSLRTALTTAARNTALETLKAPQFRFVKRSEPALIAELSEAQKGAAMIEPKLASMAQILAQGEKDRDEEMSPRWQAGFDLAYGRVLAHKVRTETYNAMLAKAKRGMVFEEEKNNTWVLEAANEVSVGSKWAREAEKARKLLQGVVDDHDGTPWALLAQSELRNPIGWKWVEKFTDLNPPARRNNNNNNNNNNAPGTDDKANMLKPRKPKPPVLKL